MRTASATALLVLAAASCGGGEGHLEPKREKEALVVLSFRLPSGLEVELAAGPCAEQVGLTTLFAVGADHDPPGRSGMAEVIARLWPTSEGERVEVGSDHTLRARAVSADRLGAELDAVAAGMGRLEVSEEALSSAQAEVLAELERRRGGDAASTARTFAAESVRPSAGGGWRGGVAAEVEALDAAEVAAHTEAHFTPGNARLTLSGDFDPFTVRRHLEEAFADVAAGTEPLPRDPADSRVTGTLVMGDAPRAVALAVPAPDPSEPTYPAFLVLAARAMSAESEGWEAAYDPIADPQMLFVTGSVAATEPAEPVAARIRAEVEALVDRPLEPGEIAATEERFATLLGSDVTDPAGCEGDPRRLSMGRARRTQLALEDRDPPLLDAVEGTSEAQRSRAAALFDPSHSAAVIGGGAIR